VNEDLEVMDLFYRFSLDLLGHTIFNHDFGRIEGKNDKYYKAYRCIIQTLNNPLYVMLPRYFPMTDKLPLKAIRDYNDAIDTFIQLFEDMIEEHKEKDGSILSELLKGLESTPNGQPLLTKEELISNIWILFIAGHETTTTSLSSSFNLLRAYPEIQEKLFQEISEKIGTEKFPTESELLSLEYLDCFIQESLRLHDSVPALWSRVATEDIPYKGMIIPKGAFVGLFFHIIQTNPEYWDEPEKFRPERWSAEERKRDHHRYAYLPFSAGPHECIGKNFSLLEQKLFIVRFLQMYKVVEPVKSKCFPVERMITAGNENFVPVGIVKREGSPTIE